MHQNIWDLPGSSPGTFQAKPWNLTQRIDPHQILDSNGVLWCYVVRCCHALIKRNGHTPTTCRNSRTLGVMFPFGAIGALVQGATCRMAALSASRGRHSGYTCLSGFFPRFSKKQLLFCSLQTVFFLLEVFPPQSRTLQRLKTSFQAEASRKYPGRHPAPTTPPKDRNRKFQGDFDNVGDFDWTEFWCLGLFSTSLQLQRARCHCSGYTGPRSPNACAPKMTRKIMKKHQNPRTQHETTLEGIVERCWKGLKWGIGIESLDCGGSFFASSLRNPSPRQSIPSFSQKQTARNRRIPQLKHFTFEQIAGNSLRPVSYSTSSCNWSSSDSILAQTSADNSPSLLWLRKSTCKLSSPVNRLSQISTGNSLSLFSPQGKLSAGCRARKRLQHATHWDRFRPK